MAATTEQRMFPSAMLIAAFIAIAGGTMAGCTPSSSETSASTENRTAAAAAVPPSTDPWIAAKAQESRGDINRLSLVDVAQLQQRTHGHASEALQAAARTRSYR